MGSVRLIAVLNGSDIIQNWLATHGICFKRSALSYTMEFLHEMTLHILSMPMNRCHKTVTAFNKTRMSV
jgi:hypothetical protein